ncbi:MAG: prephenate dehydratase [Actinobacteria bacterium]|nr:prephenate dehydratase [Actinomycetota bacterium]
MTNDVSSAKASSEDPKASNGNTANGAGLAPGDAVAFLGPRGTFTEAAMVAMPSVSSEQVAVPMTSVDAVLDAVRNGEVAAGVVPIENSLEGPVTTTLDALARDEAPLTIVEEWALPVHFALLVRPGVQLAAIAQVASIPIAAAQCRQWLNHNLPDAHVMAALSTASAAQRLAQETPPPYDAAISPAIAATHYGLDVLAEDIGDNPDARTRFVLVRRPGTPPARTGADKTTLVLFMREDHSGALLEILTEFAVRGVNLTRIESRPTRRQLGDYYFSIDCEGHIDDARVSQALTGLRRVCADVRFLGSYPRHDGKAPNVTPGTTDAAFAEAESWLTAIRNPNQD